MKHLLLLAASTCCVQLSAQTYNAGSPVYDTLVTGTGNCNYSPQGCISYELYFDPSFSTAPAGTQVFLKLLTSQLPAGALHEQTSGVLNVGDSIPAPTTNNMLEFYSSNGSGQFTFAFIRQGTPLNANDSFFCGDDMAGSSSYMVDGCMNILGSYFYAYPNVPQCAVGGPLSVDQPGPAAGFSVTTDPATGEVVVRVPGTKEPAEVQLYQLSGQLVRSFTTNSDGAARFHADAAPGVYVIRVVAGGETIGCKKFVLAR